MGNRGRTLSPNFKILSSPWPCSHRLHSVISICRRPQHQRHCFLDSLRLWHTTLWPWLPVFIFPVFESSCRYLSPRPHLIQILSLPSSHLPAGFTIFLLSASWTLWAKRQKAQHETCEFSFIWGLTEDFSSGESLSVALRNWSQEVGARLVYIWFFWLKEYMQSRIHLGKRLLLITKNRCHDYSAFLCTGRYKNLWIHYKSSWDTSN